MDQIQKQQSDGIIEKNAEETPTLETKRNVLSSLENLFTKITAKISVRALDWLIFFAAFSLIAFHLGTQSLFETSEGRYASVARAMVDGRGWIKPELNGIYHFTKPPATYWASAIGMKLFGISEKGAKAFLPIAAGLTALGCYRIGLLLTSIRSALCGTIVFITSMFFVIQFRGLSADPLLTMFETWMVWALIRYHTKQTFKYATMFWTFAGLAFLTKGPPALLPLLGLLPAMAMRGAKDSLKKLFLNAKGWIVFAVIGLGWYLWVIQTVPGLLSYFLYDETFARVATEMHKRSGPIWYFAVVLPLGIFPWTAFFIGGLGHAWREARNSEKTWGLPLFLWLLVPFVILSLAKSKLAPYALPLLVPASLITGIYIARLFREDDAPFSYKLETALTIITFAILGAVLVILSIFGFIPDPKISTIAVLAAIHFLFLAIFGYAFINLDIIKGIILILGVCAPGITLILLPTINGDEEFLRGQRLPGYRALLQRVAALPANAQIMFVNGILESAKFYTGRDIPTWGVNRETRFDQRAQKMVLHGEELLRTLATPDLYLLMPAKSRDYVRNVTHYTIDEISVLGKWGLYVCGKSLSAVSPPQASANTSDELTKSLISKPQAIDTLLAPSQVDPIARNWATAVASHNLSIANFASPARNSVSSTTFKTTKVSTASSPIKQPKAKASKQPSKPQGQSVNKKKAN